MSLEQALAENTAALKAHTAALLMGKGANAETLPEKLDRIEKTVAAPKATAKPAPKKDDPKAAEGPDYEAVKKSFLALCAAKGKDAGLAVLKPFGVQKCPDLKPEQYAEFIKASDEAATAEESLV